ncbi:MAG: type II toxin-antitoxin system VapC family toxin [bacterium]
MNKYVTDTHALVRYLNGDKVYNDTVHSIFEEADQGKNIILIPSVVLFEIGYLSEKRRIPITLHNMSSILEDSLNYIEARLSIEIINAAFEIKDIPELHDRLIAGTAYYLSLPLITNDKVILKSRYVTTV